MLSAGAHVKLSPARLIETMIIAVLAGAVSVWATTIVLKSDMGHIKENQIEAKEWYKETRDEIQELTKLVYEHDH